MPMMDNDQSSAGHHGHKWFAAEALTAYYFCDAGYVVSFPLIPAPYDLVVGKGDRLWRIQVKRARLKAARITPRGRRDRERYTVDLMTTSKSRNRRRVADFDYVCVVTGMELVYVIPSSVLASTADQSLIVRALVIKPESVNGRKDSAAAAEKWIPYRNNFELK